MAMITSAAHAPRPLDVAIGDLETAGLPTPSIVRFEPFILDHRLVRGTLGRLGADDRERMRWAMRGAMRALMPQARFFRGNVLGALQVT
jgi:mRNA interferase MazF